MRRFGKLAGFFVVFIAVMAAFCTVSFGATIRQPLTSPEAGWRRIDTNDSRIKYVGTWTMYNQSGTYNNTNAYIPQGTSVANINSSYIELKFYGSKIRFIQELHAEHTTDVRYLIDGVEAGSGNAYNATYVTQALVFEKTGLNLGMHTVKIYSGNGVRFDFDAIDIDEDGILIDFKQPINLTAIAGNKNVDLSWDSVEGATSYIVKRALTASGPYTTIATTSAITYSDSSVTNGTTYYYVISAVVNGTESPNSNEASATPTAPEVIGNPGILEITMTNGQIKEYDLSGAELLAFLNWYDGKSDGTGKAYCTIIKKNNIKPFLSRKEYIAFDKISSFEVKEYTE